MSYTVTVSPSGHQFTVDENETILDAALKQGHTLPYGCRSGGCGSCKATVIEGDAGYAEGYTPQDSNFDDNEVLLCQAYARSDVELVVREIERAEQVSIKALPCRVEKMQKLNHDVMQLFLKLPRNERLQFLPGQYLDFLLSDGRRRSFSIANAPHHDEFLELHIRYVPDGGFTQNVFNGMQEKDILRLEAPFGDFTLNMDSDLPIIFVAGGTGFAPIKGIIEHALEHDVTRPMTLYWGVRSREDLYMEELAQQWAAEYPHFTYIPVLSEPKADNAWTGRTGFVHEAVLQDTAELMNHEIYAGGPPVMVSAAHKSFINAGLKEDCFYSDPFEWACDSPR